MKALIEKGREAGMDMSINATLVVAGYESALALRALFYAGLIPDQKKEFVAHAKTEVADFLVQLEIAFDLLDANFDLTELAAMGRDRFLERIEEIHSRKKMDKMVRA